MNKKENKPQEEAKTQDKSQNQPKESFVGTGNGSSLRSRTGSCSSARCAMRRLRMMVARKW